MIANVSVFVFCFGLTAVLSRQRCPSLNAPRGGRVSCFYKNHSMSCASALPVDSRAEFKCLEFYKPTASEGKIVKCLASGSWSLPPLKCVPDCGRRSVSVSLIVSGVTGNRGEFPWHVAMYHLQEEGHEYWCGGSLVSETTVITAAHCVWHVPPEKLVFAFGKFSRGFNSSEEDVQKIKARRIETLRSYQDVSGNYNGDIAVVFLERAVTLGHFVLPVCVDWEQKYLDKQLLEGSSGVVLGWGLTENDTFSDRLRMARLPVVSDEKCIAEQEQDFRKFVTYTSFCAGFGNGTGVCNGDSGGGMTFFDEDSGRWYLQGVVSVSPRRKGTPFCDPQFYTVFTKVSLFSKWLKEMIELHGRPPQTQHSTHKTQSDSHKGAFFGKKLKFAHTKKMLQLAHLSP